MNFQTYEFSNYANKIESSAIREICKLVSKPNMRSLAGGWPDLSTFPVHQLSQLAAITIEKYSDKIFQYGTSEGLTELRNFLTKWSVKVDGLNTNLDNIMITSGSAQGMELAAKVFINPDDVVFAGLPTYFGGVNACKTFGAETVGVKIDKNGMCMNDLQDKIEIALKYNKRPKLVYIIPDFQNPTGVTLSEKRRKELIIIAEKYDLIIIEDSPYRDLRYSGEYLAPIKAFDVSERVIFLRSFSKIFCPGFRLGYAVANEKIIRQMVKAKQFEDCCTNTFGQYMLYEFCKTDLLDKQIESNCKLYKYKRDHLFNALQEHFPTYVSYDLPEGGFFIFVYLPKWMNADDLLKEAVIQNVAFVSGGSFYIDGSGQNTLRLSFSQSDIEASKQAVAILGKIIKQKAEKSTNRNTLYNYYQQQNVIN